MHKKFILFVWVVTLGGCAQGKPEQDHFFRDHEVDEHFLMRVDVAQRLQDQVPEGARLREVVEMGASALQWFESLQSHRPERERMELWRRVDALGKEPTPDLPRVTTTAVILRAFEDAMQAAPQGMRDGLENCSLSGAPPAQLPDGVELETALLWLKRVHRAYSAASRFLALYPSRESRSQRTRDFRPLLKIRRDRQVWIEAARAWPNLAQGHRNEMLLHLDSACAVADAMNSQGPACRGRMVDLEWSRTGQQAEMVVVDILEGLDRAWESRFKVVRPFSYPSVRATEDVLYLGFSLLNADWNFLEWMRRLISGAWNKPGRLKVHLFEAQQRASHTVMVQWRAGALPNVNGAGGNLITMDQNMPLWLEQVEATMIHEFGHVLGFPDCYVEFWSESEQGFVYYTLDPANRMCALSGETLPLHAEALERAYR